MVRMRSAIVLFAFLAALIFSMAVHEAVHVYQAWRSPLVRIGGIDTSFFTGGCCIGAKFVPEGTSVVGFAEESKDWERDAYLAQGASFILSYLGLIYGYARWM